MLSPQIKKWQLCEVMEELTKSTVAIISQYISVADHQVSHIKLHNLTC